MAGGTATVALLFTDVVVAAAPPDDLGEERAENLRRTHFRLLREAAAGAGAQLKNLGDGIMVVAASPAKALGVAVELLRRVELHNATNPDETFATRVALHAGEPILDEEDYFATSVLLTKSLCRASAAGEVIISDALRDLTGDVEAVTFEPRSDHVVGVSLVRWDAVRRAPAPPARTTLPASVLTAASTVFVGRAEELAALRQAWSGVVAGTPHVALLSGEPGVGKTRLAAQAAAAAHRDGAIVLQGRCDEEPLTPYQPFVEALRWYVGTRSADELRAHDKRALAVLSRLVPGLAELQSGLPDRPPAEPDTERYWLFEAVATLLREVAARHPVLLLLDDLQWADKPSLLLLRHLVHATPAFALGLIGTFRDSEVSRGHPLAELVADLGREGLLTRVAVAGLPDGDVRTLIEGLVGNPPPTQLVHEVRSRTEGNPFFIQEVVRDLVESGGAPVGTWRSVDKLGIPEGVKEAVATRLRRLSPVVQQTLSAAAVIGREFESELLGELVERGPDELLDALEEALEARVVGEVHGRPGRFAFTHALIRESLYAETSGARRIPLHLRAGELLEQRHRDNLEPHLGELAHHFLAGAPSGRDLVKAVSYARRAGDHALQVLAYEEAVAHYQRALEAMGRMPAADETDRCEVLLSLGDAQWRAGDAPASEQTFEAAAAAARNLADPARLARAALGYGAGIGGFGFILAANWPLIRLLEDALAAQPDGDSATRVRLLARLAAELYYTDELDRRRALADEAVAMAERLGDRTVRLAAIYSHQAATLGPDAALDERLRTSTEIVRLATELGSDELQFRGRLFRMGTLIELGDIPAAREETDACAGLAGELRMPIYRWVVGLHDSMWAAADGRFEEAVALAEAALAIGQQAEPESAFGSLGAQLAAPYWALGRLHELTPAVAMYAEQFTWIPAYRCTLAWAYAEQGQNDEAQAVLDGLAEHDFADIPRDASWVMAMWLLSLACGFLRDAERAKVMYDLLLPFEDQGAIVGLVLTWSGSVALPLGSLASAMGRWDDAERHFQKSLEFNERANGRPWIVQTLYHRARMLLDRNGAGDRAEAERVLDETLTLAREMGMTAWAEAAPRMLGL